MSRASASDLYVSWPEAVVQSSFDLQRHADIISSVEWYLLLQQVLCKFLQHAEFDWIRYFPRLKET